jgi:hypothetical protein
MHFHKNKISAVLEFVSRIHKNKQIMQCIELSDHIVECSTN